MSALVCGGPPCRLEDLIALPDELGKPNPDRLRLYRAYLHWQLQRGVMVRRDSGRLLDEKVMSHITEAGYDVLRVLSTVDEKGSAKMAKELGHSTNTMWDQGRRLKRLGWIETTTGKHSLWRITEAGRRALAEHDGAAAD